MALLENLPPELLEAIASYLDPASLAAMIRTRRRIKASCTPLLYKDIVVDDIGCIHLEESIDRNQDLVAHIRSITFAHGEFYADHYADTLLPKIQGIMHLRYFAREQGFFDRGADEDENALGLGLWWPGPNERVPRSLRAAAASISTWLPALRTCTLEFFSLCPEWDLGPKSVLFLHPNLKSLDIHHAYHDSDLKDPPDKDSNKPLEYWRSPIFDADPGPMSTNLKALRFHHCKIDAQALEKILSFPRSLKHFTLTHEEFGTVERYQTGVELVVEALRQQKESLETLNIQGLKVHPAGIRLGSFPQLQILEIGMDLLFGEIEQGKDYESLADPHGLQLDTAYLLPSSLRQITLRYRMVDEPVVLSRLEALERCVVWKLAELPNLRQVSLIEEKLKENSATLSQGFVTAIQQRMAVILEHFVSHGVDAKHEVEELDVEPWSPRLCEMMGYVGNAKYRESYERRWGFMTQK